MATSEKSELKLALKACKGTFITTAVFSMFINILMLVPAVYMLQLYDRVITSGSESTLVSLTVLVIFLFIVMGILEWLRSQLLVRVSSKIEVLLNQRLFNATFKQALLSGGAKSSAQPLDDLTSLRQFFTGNGLFAFFDAPWLPIYIAVMFLFHPWYGWMAVTVAVILSILAFINEKATNKPLSEANQMAVFSRGSVNKNLRNAEVVESMGMLANLRQRWLESASQVIALQAIASSRAGLMTSLSKTIRMGAQSLILGLGAYLVLQQEISPGLMIAGSILLGRALAPIDLMIGTWKGFVAARGQYKRLDEMLTVIPDDKDKMELPEPKGTLVVENILVAPPGTKTPVIRGVNFSLAAGDSLGIIGASGAGKSTLARALIGIWPALSGKVRLDGADIYNWDRQHLGPYIGYLPQDVELFEGSISENIARFGNVESDKIVEASQIADVHEMILKLPEGYDTIIGANGGVLSGGQRQRIGLARAIYGNPKFILLDEPNSNLDEQGERALAKAILTLKSRKITIIVITHRTGVLGTLDKVLLLTGGQMQLFGPREQVFEKIAATAKANAPEQIK
ncbi:MAG: type I secretion system permease/ATPase [Methylococcaceae bacterium]|nr:type I secretion system permease/ATPase [Methylococcaceae bacterium]